MFSIILAIILIIGVFLGGLSFLSTKKVSVDSIVSHILETSPIEYGNVNNVPLYAQTKNLSCESASIRMLLRYHGIEAEEEQIQAKFSKSLNPNLGFRGDVNGNIWGIDNYGVHAEPVSKVIQKYGLNAKAYKDISEDELKKKVLDGNPAIIWVNISNPNPEQKIVKIGKQEVKLISGEHTVVVTGYKNGYWYLNDPWKTTSEDGQRIAGQTRVKSLVEIMWNSFDYMTVIIENKEVKSSSLAA